MAKSEEQIKGGQFVEADVSKKKFQAELKIFLKRKNEQLKRGIVLINAEFPNMEFAFLAPQISPSPLVFAVRINFDNYDVEPLSVKLFDLFTGELLPANRALTVFKRRTGEAPNVGYQQLLQYEALDTLPFFCIPGVREYHEHPYHTGDSWLLHRKQSGEGTLGYLLDKLYEYGIGPLNGYNIQLAMAIPNLSLGVDLNKVPE